jgi:hypothetical protein
VLTDRDNGAQALVERIRALAKPATLTVGVHADAPAVDHAAVVEFGTSTHVPKPYLRPWADGHVSEHRADMREVARAALAGEQTLEVGLAALGERYAAEVRELAPEGTGELRGSITAEVDR